LYRYRDILAISYRIPKTYIVASLFQGSQIKTQPAMHSSSVIPRRTVTLTLVPMKHMHP